MIGVNKRRVMGGRGADDYSKQCLTFEAGRWNISVCKSGRSGVPDNWTIETASE